MAERFAKVNEQGIRELLDNATPKHGTACAWNGATFSWHGTARLHLSFCRTGLKIGTGPSTGVAWVSHTDFSTARHGRVFILA